MHPGRVQQIAADGSYVGDLDIPSAANKAYEPQLNGLQSQTDADIETGPDGTTYVADPFNSRVMRYDTDGDLLQTSSPLDAYLSDNGSGVLGMINALAVRPDGTVIVSHVDLNTTGIVLYEYSPTLVQQGVYATLTGNGLGAFAAGIAVDPDGSVLYTDGNHDTVRVSADGSTVTSIAGLAEDRSAIAIAPDSTVWTIHSNGDLKHWQADGTPIGTFAGNGTGNGQLFAPIDLEVEADGDVWVADDGRGDFQRFSSAGAWQETVDPDPSTPGLAMSVPVDVSWAPGCDARAAAADALGSSGRWWMVDDTGVITEQAAAVGGGDGQLLGMPRTDMRSDCSFWVVDGVTSRIQRLSSAGAHIATIDTSGISAQPPVDVAIIDATHLLVAFGDSTVHRVTTAGVDELSFGSGGAGDGQFDHEVRVRVDASGKYHVSDSHRIQRFSTAGAHEATLDVGAGFTNFNPDIPDFGVFSDGDLALATAGGVKRMQYDGTVVETIGYPTDRNGAALTMPTSLDVEADEIVAAETLNSTLISHWAYDATAPSVTLTGTDQGGGVVRFTASVASGGAPPMSDGYSFNGGSSWNATAYVDVTGVDPGETVTRSVRVRDIAGNTTSSVTGSFTMPGGDTDTDTDLDVDLQTRLTTDSSSASGVVPASADDELSVAITGADGPVRVSATVGGVRVPVSVSGARGNGSRTAIVRISGVAEGWRTLVVRVVGVSSGRTRTYRQRILIDRTAPTARRIGAMVLPRGSTKVRVLDPLSGATGRRKYRVRRLPLGRSRIVVRTKDRAGNTARRSTVVWRRISLSSPAANTDLRLPRKAKDRFTPTQDVLSRVFGYDGPAAPWYRPESESPVVVREIEWRLREMGYLPRTHRLRGRISITVIRAIQAYQRAEGLPPLGTVGPRTSRHMDADLARLKPGRRKFVR